MIIKTHQEGSKTTKEEIIERFKILRMAVDIERYTQGEMTNYKWEIGVKIYEELKSWCAYNFTDEEGVAPQIMGIPIEVNYAYPDVIKLWKEVKV